MGLDNVINMDPVIGLVSYEKRKKPELVLYHERARRGFLLGTKSAST